MKVAIVLSSLRSGGAERVVYVISRYWAQRNWDVTILTLSGAEEGSFYDLDPAVVHVPLALEWRSPNKIAGFVSGIKRTLRLRRELGKLRPDVVVSFMDTTNVLCILSVRGMRVPIVVSVRNDPARMGLSTSWRILRSLLYPFADRVVVQTDRARAFFSKRVQSRCLVIPNPVLPPSADAGGECAIMIGRPAAIAMGRLSRQKGFDILIDAFARLRERFPRWRLVIIGEGPSRAELESQARHLEITDRVEFTGRVKHPHRLLEQGDLFVLSSRYEGFPNALCEAMACGLPVVSFDCPNGPREIIRDGLDGLLVAPEDTSQLAASMSALMQDAERRNELGRKAREITTRFGLEQVMASWDGLLTELVSERRGL